MLNGLIAMLANGQKHTLSSQIIKGVQGPDNSIKK